MLTDDQRKTINEVVSQNKNLPGALLPILHGIQDVVGYVPPEAVEAIAKELNLSRAEVHGVITYYHHFKTASPGKHVVQICRAESCQSMGAEQLWAHACLQLGSDGHSPTSDGMFTVEPAYCLGLCASSPSMAINGKVHARVNVEKFNKLVAHARSQA